MKLRHLNPLTILTVLVVWIFVAPVVLSLWNHLTQPLIEKIAEVL